MRFHLSEEQVAIQDTLRGTLVDALPPDRLHALVDGEEEYDAGSWSALMVLGLGGLHLPERYGGSGLELVDAALAMEVLGYHAATGPAIGHLVAGLALNLSGDEALKRRHLPALVSGETMVTLALGSGWVPQSWDIAYNNGAVHGTVEFVAAARSANLYMVGLQGGRLALAVNDDSVTVTPLPTSDRTRRLSRLTFSGTPATIIDTDAEKIFDAALVLIAADALGGAQKALDLSVAYAKERVQFGQPIGRFQALKHQLATMALEVETSRALVWYAAHALDRELEDASRVAAIAKAHLASCFTSVTRAAVAAHGGIGFTWEYDLSIWVKRSFLDNAWLGTPAFHRKRAADMAGW